MRKYINLFKILGDSGREGLFNYLKNVDDDTLKILKNQYSIERKYKERDDIIQNILLVLERTLNIGHVFNDKGKVELARFYK